MADNSWVDQISLGNGVSQDDVPLIQRQLAPLFSRLDAWAPGNVDLWLRVKNRDGAGMKTTLELQVPKLPMLLASSKRDDFGAALDRVGDKMVRRVNEAADKYADRGRDTIRR